MIVNMKIDVKNMTTKDPGNKYLVLTNDNSKIWFYGLYSDKERAEAAINERPEYRFMAEVVNE